MRKLILSTVTLSLLLGGCASTPAPAPSDGVVSSSPDAPTSPVDSLLPGGVEAGSNEALAWEALMGPDGEYAAAAHYQAVLDEYGDVEPYQTIKTSEERHIDALVRQLSRYGIEVPDNPYMGTIQAPDNLEAAARAWAEGEVANVEMYDALIEQATDDRLIRVLENLRRASLEQHLPAFEAAAANGGTLDPAQMQGMGNQN